MCVTYIQLNSHFHLGPVSHESRSQDTCVTSIHVAVHPHQGIQICISAQLNPHLSCNWSPWVASKLHPNHISTMPGLRDVHLTSIYVHSHCHRSPLIGVSSPPRSRFACVLVESHLNLSHDNCISAAPRSNYTPIQVSGYLCLTATPPPSTPSRPLDSRLTIIQIESHPNPGPYNCISPPSSWRITSHQAPTIASQIHRDTISDPPRFQNVHLTSILALAHLNPEPKNIASPPSMYPLTSIQVHRFPSYTYLGNVSNPSTPPRLTSHIPPVRISPQSSSRYLHLTSTQMMSHLHPCPRILVLPPSRYWITPIQVQKLFSHNDPHRGSHLSRFHLTQIQDEMWVSYPSTPNLFSI